MLVSDLFCLLFPEYRLDWFGAGPSSPNKTGALLAILFVCSWLPALRFRWGYWLSLGLAALSSVFLLQTESRGALVAVCCAVGFLVVSRFAFNSEGLGASVRALPSFLKAHWLRLGAGVIAIALLGVYSQQLGVNDRFAVMASGQDGSSNVRVALYSAGMQMIAAAPSGWGAGQAGNVYAQWYQEIGDGRSYLSLVNSHLTWMSDYGWRFQVVYIAGWCLAFLLCWPSSWTPLRVVTFASWLTLGLSGFFSSVLTLIWLWVVPVCLLVGCLVQSFRLDLWPSRPQQLICALSMIACFAIVHLVAHAMTGDPRIVASKDRVEVGARPQAVGLVQPDRTILGDKYGHTIREYLDDVEGFTVVLDAGRAVDLSAFDSVVFSGRVELSDLGGYAGPIVWMNPPADIDDAVLELLAPSSLTVIVGRLGDWRRARVWQRLVDENPNWEITELRGAANFIPNWPRFLLAQEDEGGVSSVL